MNQSDLKEIEHYARCILAAVQNVRDTHPHYAIDSMQAVVLKSIVSNYLRLISHAIASHDNSSHQSPSPSSSP